MNVGQHVSFTFHPREGGGTDEIGLSGTGAFAMADVRKATNHWLSISALMAVDKICRQFEAELKAGKEPRVDAFRGDMRA